MTATAAEHEIRHVHELLFLRELFADRGLAKGELQWYDAAITEAREQLAESARPASAGLAA
jgi:hypothetical protein